jgi:hypothetical protein
VPTSDFGPLKDIQRAWGFLFQEEKASTVRDTAGKIGLK